MTRRYSNGHQRPLSRLIRRDSLDNGPPARPPRPRESIDMSLFADKSPTSPIAATIDELERALGPLKETASPATIATPSERAWFAPRRIPPPSVDKLKPEVVAPAAVAVRSSTGTTKSTHGRRAARREELRRLSSLLGSDVLTGVDVEAIVAMERNRSKASTKVRHESQRLWCDFTTVRR
jgi:hypothetical protein